MALQSLSYTNPSVEALKQKAVTGVTDVALWLRDYVTAVKHGQWHPYTPLEREIRGATRNEPWGPTGPQLQTLAVRTASSQNCEVIWAVLEYRLSYRFGRADRWRCVYKALTVMESLIKRGHERCVALSRELVPMLEELHDFEYVDITGRDQGVNIRMRSKAITDLLLDDAHLREERQKFKSQKGKFQGYSRDDMAAGNDRGGSTWHQAPGEHYSDSDDEAPQPSRRPDARHSAAPRQIPPAGGGKAGEMKGVTMKENEAHLAALAALLKRPENAACADCACGSASSRPTWASINLGAFICMKCAGIHRGLGVHISQVRSTTLDTWRTEQVDFMARTGNAAVNAHFEARLPESYDRPSAAAGDLSQFIRLKYSSKAWVNPSAGWPPTLPPAAAQTATPSGPPPAPRPTPPAAGLLPDLWDYEAGGEAAAETEGPPIAPGGGGEADDEFGAFESAPTTPAAPGHLLGGGNTLPVGDAAPCVRNAAQDEVDFLGAFVDDVGEVAAAADGGLPAVDPFSATPTALENSQADPSPSSPQTPSAAGGPDLSAPEAEDPLAGGAGLHPVDLLSEPVWSPTVAGGAPRSPAHAASLSTLAASPTRARTPTAAGGSPRKAAVPLGVASKTMDLGQLLLQECDNLTLGGARGGGDGGVPLKHKQQQQLR